MYRKKEYLLKDCRDVIKPILKQVSFSPTWYYIDSRYPCSVSSNTENDHSEYSFDFIDPSGGPMIKSGGVYEVPDSDLFVNDIQWIPGVGVCLQLVSETQLMTNRYKNDFAAFGNTMHKGHAELCVDLVRAVIRHNEKNKKKICILKLWSNALGESRICLSGYTKELHRLEDKAIEDIKNYIEPEDEEQ